MSEPDSPIRAMGVETASADSDSHVTISGAADTYIQFWRKEPRSFRERWLSLPWRPWVRDKLVKNQVLNFTPHELIASGRQEGSE